MADEKKNLMYFGYGLAVIALFFAVGGYIKHGLGLATVVLFMCAAIFALTTLLKWEALRPGYKGWMKVAHVIGGVVTTVLLTTVFFLVFTPVALVLKLFGKDHLERRINKAAATYWHSRHGDDLSRERLEQQF